MEKFKTLNGYEVKDEVARNDSQNALTRIGDLTELDTTDKTSVVNAINEVVNDINTNVYVKDDYLTLSGTRDPDDPETPVFYQIELPSGWTIDNTILLGCKVRQESQQVYGCRNLNHIDGSPSSYFIDEIRLQEQDGHHYIIFFPQYWDLAISEPIIYQLTFMKIELPTTNE